MTTATFSSANIAQSQPTSVGVALQDLAVATQRLASALWASIGSNGPTDASNTSETQAAQELRAFASSIAATDPSFASDLFAAADRHEFGDNA